ncbi:LOW QUALITY PROTEIN: ATP-binding cassette transporter sub-family A, partial [Elysia marginata]
IGNSCLKASLPLPSQIGNSCLKASLPRPSQKGNSCLKASLPRPSQKGNSCLKASLPRRSQKGNSCLKASLPRPSQIGNSCLKASLPQPSQIYNSCLKASLPRPSQIGAKHLQAVSGARPLSYWGMTFAVDYLVYSMGAVLMLTTFFLIPEEAYIGPTGKWPLLLLVLATYGWASLSMLYAIHHLFGCAASGAVFTVVFNIVTRLFIKLSPVPSLPWCLTS